MPSSCTGCIEARNLTFAYPARPSSKVLNNLSLGVPAGKNTALAGPSGCGKSTLVGLLEHWYNSESGQLLLDANQISSYNTKQEPILFSSSVFENVTKGLLDEQRSLSADDHQFKLIQSACEASEAHDFIHELPDGYGTRLGESAGMLSGGQRIISDPKVFLLDEAASALDPHAEPGVSQGRTVLVPAHKLATIKDADNISVIANGSVVEQGTHEQLIEQGGPYAALVRTQGLGHGDQRGGNASKVNEDETELN
ncbi:MAG: hypothetical protein LQ343_002366 [Gyalolechia ehrenbergii]|nr:MAG: hypothetical protein LQ343_002366 [Gyalolechia ehrenbergii]